VPSCAPTGTEPVLQLHPTRFCNLACAHCYSASSPHTREELSLELLTACLDDAAALGYRQLAVSGGEPLLYTALAELLAHAKALGMITAITTNGTLTTPARWKRIAPLLDVAAISIDGRPDEHDAIRRRAGAFARTVANLDIVRRSSVPFGFIFTLTQHNADRIEFVVRLAAEHGARSVQVHPLTLHGRARASLPDARPDEIELCAALAEAARLGHELGTVVHVDAVTRQQLVLYRSHLAPRGPVGRLVDVAPVLVVDPSGFVVPLTHEVDAAFRLGSLHDDSLASLAGAWVRCGRADDLASACERAWDELTASSVATAYWYEEVAAHTQDTRCVLSTR
jgi:MoaA/NifB/PqqE/SkfB family radical SAM enzyme